MGRLCRSHATSAEKGRPRPDIAAARGNAGFGGFEPGNVWGETVHRNHSSRIDGDLVDRRGAGTGNRPQPASRGWRSVHPDSGSGPSCRGWDHGGAVSRKNSGPLEGAMSETKLDAERRVAMYRRMMLCRRFEERVYYLFLEGRLPGTIHQSQGQEATAVGVCSSLNANDMI